MIYEEVTIEESGLEIIDGDRGKHYPKKNELLPTGYCVFLNTKNIVDDRFVFNEVEFIDEKKDSLLRKGKLQRGDFVITTRGTVGNVAFYSNDIPFERIRINSGMVIVRNNNVFDSRYLYLLLKSPYVKSQFIHYSSGSAQPQLPIRDLKKVKLIKPKRKIQEKIADILGSLDDKIELNRRMNETLEQMAMALYKHWFVDFGPFQDGEFVECEIGMIPKGWEIGKLGDVYFTSSGGTPKRDVKSYYEGGTINWLKTKELDDGFIFSTEEKITDSGLQNSSAKIFPENTVVMAMYGATVGKLGILGCPSSTNQACCAIIPQKDEFGYEYIFLYLLYNRSNIIKLANGGAQQNISQQIIKELKILLPPSHVMKEINSNFKWLFSLIRENQRESMYLKETRDYLLPRLLSGEIGLREAEEQVEEVLANA